MGFLILVFLYYYRKDINQKTHYLNKLLDTVTGVATIKMYFESEKHLLGRKSS